MKELRLHERKAGDWRIRAIVSPSDAAGVAVLKGEPHRRFLLNFSDGFHFDHRHVQYLLSSTNRLATSGRRVADEGPRAAPSTSLSATQVSVGVLLPKGWKRCFSPVGKEGGRARKGRPENNTAGQRLVTGEQVELRGAVGGRQDAVDLLAAPSLGSAWSRGNLQGLDTRERHLDAAEAGALGESAAAGRVAESHEVIGTLVILSGCYPLRFRSTTTTSLEALFYVYK
ncbi:hypothetical protein EYF80_023883 [Liparis tanakae]|uniref:Uncharacterized protein n=1 Tax=Liparis tanakae TaxID=230148 RepID=A0A4Z2HLL4_9TELE|nr:hypothetical protein EYF80_023883 [Liparis tanakae]